MSPIITSAGRREASLRLDVLGYQFPDIEDGWDADWLMIRMAARDGQREWHVEDPALTTVEARELVAWLRRVAARESHAPARQPSRAAWAEAYGPPSNLGRFEALEPKIGFRAHDLEDAIELVAIFSHEFLPETGTGRRLAERHELPLRVSPEDIERFASALEADASRFPVRWDRRAR